MKAREVIKNISVLLVPILLLNLLFFASITFTESIEKACAANTSGDYIGEILIVNSCGAQENISVNLTLSVPELINGGYLQSDCELVDMFDSEGNNAIYMPGYNTNPWMIWLDEISSNLSTYYTLYTSSADETGNTKYYFPDNNGMTINDDSSLELGDNYSITFKGFINTDAIGDNITSKESALRTYINSSDNVTVVLYPDDWTNPTGHNDPASAWSNETNAYDDNISSYATDPAVFQGAWSEYLEFTFDSATISSLRVYYFNTNFNKTDADLYYDGSWNDYYEDNTTQGSYQELDGGPSFNVTSARVRFYNGGGSGAQDIALSEFDYGNAISASIPNLPSEEYELAIESDGVFFSIGADATTADFPISDNLVLNAPLHHADLSGATFDTKDSNEYTCTVSGATWSSDGYVFNGSSDYISFSGYSANNTWTVEGWFYITEDDFHSIVGDSIANYGYLVYHDITQKIWYEPSSVNGKGIDFNLTSGSLINAWHHIALVMDTPTLYCYVDNELVGQGDPIDGICDLNITRIGGGYEGIADSLFEGTMGEIRIYSDAIDTTDNYEATAWKYNGSSENFHYQYSGGVSVPDNLNNWVVCGNVTSYMEYFEINVGGVQKGYWEWEYDSTFSDQSGNNNTATPTFKTEGNTCVTANLTSFEPVDLAQAPQYTVQGAPDFFSLNTSIAGNFSTGNVATGGPPGFAVVEDIATGSETPNIWIWGIIGTVTIASTGLGLSYARRKYNIGGGYVIMCIVIGVVVIGLMIAFKKFDWWMLWFYIMMSFGIGMASRHIDWGGATSQHSIIGFLAMAFIGLTLINRILEGAFISEAETTFLNTVAFTQTFSVASTFSIPILNFQFFTEGIPALMRWDYSFFGGQAQIVQYLLYSITAVVSFIIFTIILGLVYNYFSRLR